MHFAVYGAGLYARQRHRGPALDYLLERSKSCAPNLANSRRDSVKEVIAVAEKVCGRSIPLKIASRCSGDPPILMGDAGRAQAPWLETYSFGLGDISEP
jgi:UDP-arabinose 4-epimerase